MFVLRQSSPLRPWWGESVCAGSDAGAPPAAAHPAAYRSLLLLMLLGILIPTASMAQGGGRRIAGGDRHQTFSASSMEAETLFGQYRFDEAEAALSRRPVSTGAGEVQTDLLRRCRLGSRMLASTQRLVVIDSMVVKRDSLWRVLPSRMRGGSDAGAVGNLGDVCPVFLRSFLDQENQPDLPQELGSAAYINSWRDRLVFSARALASASDSCQRERISPLKLYGAERWGDSWSDPQPLPGLCEAEEEEASSYSLDYPFLCADGQTLYFALAGEESLGGYDLFVTSWNAEQGRYVRAENLGFPFNSPANDYLLCLDEELGLGWFVSDRHQPSGWVCIYTFLPTDQRETYSADELPKDSLRSLAMLTRISSTWSSESAGKVAAAREVLRALPTSRNIEAADREGAEQFRLVVSGVRGGERVVRSVGELQSARARRVCGEWLSARSRLRNLLSDLALMRRGARTAGAAADADKRVGASLRAEISRAEAEAATLREKVHMLYRSIQELEHSAGGR